MDIGSANAEMFKFSSFLNVIIYNLQKVVYK